MYSKSGSVASEIEVMILSTGYQNVSREMSLLLAGQTMSVVGIDSFVSR